MKEIVLIEGKKVYEKGKFISRSFLIKEGKVFPVDRTEISTFAEKRKAFLIIPPFADAHIHGGWEYSFEEPESYPRLEKLLKSKGIFLAVPTLMSLSIEKASRIASTFLEYKKSNPDSIFPFLRIEGPFINPEKAGFQKRSTFLQPQEKEMEAFFNLSPSVKMFTFAPELEGSKDLVRRARERGMIPSAGHSNASFADFAEIYHLGVRHMTHFPNAMRGLHHREIGLTGAGFYFQDVTLEVIGDGVHLSFDFLRLLNQIKHRERIHLVSDALPPAGLEKGKVNGREVRLEGGVFLDQEGKIAGGALMVDEQFRLLHFQAGFPLDILVDWACLNFLRFLGIGEDFLKEGEPAHFIALDEELRFSFGFFRGKEINPSY